jgi:hypothetical protein
MRNLAPFATKSRSSASGSASGSASSSANDSVGSITIDLCEVQPFIEKFAEFITTEIPELSSYVAIAKMMPTDLLLLRFKGEISEYGSAEKAADALLAKAGVSPNEKTREKIIRYLQFFTKIADCVWGAR